MNLNDPDVKGSSAERSAAEDVTSTLPRASSDETLSPELNLPPPPNVSPPLPPADRRSRGAKVFGVMALIVAVLAMLASFYAWQRSDRVVREAARRWQEVEARVTQIDQQFTLLQDQSRDLIGRSAVQENKLGEMSQQQTQLERLYKNFAADTLDSVLADTEMAVSIASQQLQVAGNVQAALIALQDAENSLKRAEPHAVASLQRLLASDVERLRGVPQVDIAGLSLRLDSIMSTLGHFPMLSGVTPPGEASTAAAVAPVEVGSGSVLARLADLGRRGWDSLRNELLQLIRVNRIDDSQAALLAPEQQYFVRENLRLSLLSARLALLARNDAVLHSDLTHAIDWLTRYYDVKNKAVSNALDSIKQIQQNRLTTDLPSLSDTLTAVRAQRAAREASR